MMMKTFALACVLLLLAHGGNAQPGQDAGTDMPPPDEGGAGTDVPPEGAVTDVPPEGGDVPTTPPTSMDTCFTEDAALEACMIGEGTAEAARDLCDLCVEAAYAVTSAIASTSCDDLATPDNGLCVALGVCPTCPVGCSAEMAAYALCEVNDELGLDCQTLECNVVDPGTETPTVSPAPTVAGGTPAEMAPTDAASTPTEAAPTEAAATSPTEAPPTATPTSMASPTYYTIKIGALVAGLLVIATAI